MKPFKKRFWAIKGWLEDKEEYKYLFKYKADAEFDCKQGDTVIQVEVREVR